MEIRRKPAPDGPESFTLEIAGGGNDIFVFGYSYPDGGVTLTFNKQPGVETNEEELERWLPFLASVLAAPADPIHRLRGSAQMLKRRGQAIATLIATHREEFARLLAAERRP